MDVETKNNDHNLDDSIENRSTVSTRSKRRSFIAEVKTNNSVIERNDTIDPLIQSEDNFTIINDVENDYNDYGLITRRRRFGGASASPGSPAGHCNCIDFDNSSVVLLHCKPIVLISQAVLSCLTLLLTRPLIPD